MPCKKCGKKWKWGEKGECKYDSKDACEKANPKNYESAKSTKVIELLISDESEELTIDAISLVTSPAIEQDFVYFGKEKNNLTFAKIDKEKRMLVSPALIPEKTIFRYDPNTDSDYYVYFSKDTVRKAAELYLKHNNHHKATYQHEERVPGVLTVESWIKEGEQDKSKLYGYDLPNGTWFVKMRIDNDEMWNKIKEGELKGLSIEGYFTNKFEQMQNKKPTNLEILSALNEIIKDYKKTNKIELGLVQDGEEHAENLLEIAEELAGTKKDIARTMKRIESYENDGMEYLRFIKKTINEIEKINKEMGITVKIPQLKKMEKAISEFNKAQMIKI